jgi:hypothetical protein
MEERTLRIRGLGSAFDPHRKSPRRSHPPVSAQNLTGKADCTRTPTPSNCQIAATWRPSRFAGLEGVENLRADRPRSSAPGTLRRRCSRLERRDDCWSRARINYNAVLAHMLIVLLQPGRQSEPQFNLGFHLEKIELSADEAAFRSTQAEDPFYQTSPNSSLIQYQYLDLISPYCA